MTRCLICILALLLAGQCFALVKEPITKEYPTAEDGFGRTVWYNPVLEVCEDANGMVVKCPEGIQVSLRRNQ